MVPCERTGHLFPFVSPDSLSLLISLHVFLFDITYARSETDPGDPGSEGPESIRLEDFSKGNKVVTNYANVNY